MKIYLNQLSANLKQDLKNTYLIYGDEPFLLDEAAQIILKKAKACGFQNKHIFYGEQSSPESFLNELNNLSLFSEKTLLDLRFNNKPSQAWQNALKTFSDLNPDDKILLLRLPKLDTSTQKTAWLKKLDEIGVSIPIYPVKPTEFPRWLAQQAKQLSLSLPQDLIGLICEKTEGNLLAAHQTLEKIALTGDISQENVTAQLSDNAHHDVFQLCDAILASDTKRIGLILNTLKQEGIEPTIILWAITQEINKLLTIANDKREGKALNDIFKSLRIWQDKQNLIMQYFKTHKTRYLYPSLTLANQVDRQIKGLNPGNIWQSLLLLSLKLIGKNI